MTNLDLLKLKTFQTRPIAEACKESQETADYVEQCVVRFFLGDYGEIDEEDTEYNNEDLRAGEGHVLARYKAFGQLTEDIYIESHFSNTIPGVDANNNMIMYCSER